MSIEGSAANEVVGNGAAGKLVMLADTRPLDPPEKISDYSSHAILWDAIRDEILDNPFILNDVAEYLDNRRQQLQIPEENFDRLLFVESLIVPAFAQGICRLLMKLKLPLFCAARGGIS